MIRTIWTLFWGACATLWHAGWAVIDTHLGRSELERRCLHHSRAWGRALVRASGSSIEISGTEHLDARASYILVANHESWFDVFALSWILPLPYRFVAKKELASIPVFGRAWRGCGHVSVDRGNREAAIESLQRAGGNLSDMGVSMIFFPEGTRSRDGKLHGFKKGAFVLAIQSGVPIVPVGIAGTRRIMPAGSFRVRSGRIRVLVGEPIPVEGLVMRDRDDLLRTAHTRVRELRDRARAELAATQEERAAPARASRDDRDGAARHPREETR